jgi:hypothetical protein
MQGSISSRNLSGAVMSRWYAAIGLLVLSLPAAAADAEFFGLLRARDLTPFGYLRLDMRPAYAGSLTPGTWVFETDIAYQNTWAVSPEVERYLNSLPGRRELGPAELEAIRDLPGENYLVDLELAQIDFAVHRQFSEAWGAYAIFSGAAIGGGFLDSTIEGFHRLIDAPRFGRPAIARNDANLLFDLKSGEYVSFEAPTTGGLLDPVIGVRYTTKAFRDRWTMTVESAVKVPLADRKASLSTGRSDVGVQFSLQRFWEREAFYLNLAGVYYSGMKDFVPEPSQVLPTLIVGYERRLTSRTNLIAQAYLSRSVYEREQTDLAELLGTKYQLSLGVRHRVGGHLISFAMTENLQNINNTPDVGFQIGWSFAPKWSQP